MRVTNKMMLDSVTGALNRSTQSLVRLSEKLSTGKKINRPSHDPIGMARVMEFRKSISKIKQYMSNIARGKILLETTESTLDGIEKYVDMAREIAVDQSVAVLDTRDEAAQQLKSIYDQILQLANSKYGNTYLFAGNKSDTMPFSRDADGIEGTADDYDTQYFGDDGSLKVVIAENSTAKVGTNGQELFTGDGIPGGINVFDVLKELINGLENPDTEAGTVQIRDQIDSLGQAQAQINSVRTRNAGTYERLKITETYWNDFKYRLENLLSGVWDTNTEQTVVELKNQEIIYETTISLAGEILNINLMNFLR